MGRSIVWLDPGGTTGLVWVHRATDDMKLLGSWLRSNGTYGGYAQFPAGGNELQCAHDIVDYISDVHVVHGLGTIGFESFQLRTFNSGANLLAPVRMQAFITAMLFARMPDSVWNRVRFEEQPASVLRTINSARLKALGLWIPGQQHARSATAHLVAYLRKHA